MQTIRLELPEEIELSLNTIPMEKERFIIDAIKEKLNRLTKSRFNEILIEGYKNSQEEDLEITKEFEFADFQE